MRQEKPLKRPIRSPVATPGEARVGSLGPYDLLAPLAKGGMAEVWRGVHRAQDIPVAIKFLLGPNAKDPSFRESFQTEVRAVAGLDHPHIVVLLDYGQVPPTIQTASLGHLLADQPYLVMEYSGGGSLQSSPLPRSWAELKSILLQLLDALAHAHARGIIHLDLKPGNVLMEGAGDLRPGLKLTDFGIAQVQQSHQRQIDLRRKDLPPSGTARSRSRNKPLVVGTPRYMAPEQFMGDAREFSPATDLYSLGCIAYGLASGTLPFPHREFAALMYAHLNAAPPPLVPRIPVPDGFAPWVAQLLAKAPQDRFARAADAAFMLQQLDLFTPEETSGGDTPVMSPEPRTVADPPATFPLPRGMLEVTRKSPKTVSGWIVPSIPSLRSREESSLEGLELDSLDRSSSDPESHEPSLIPTELGDIPSDRLLFPPVDAARGTDVSEATPTSASQPAQPVELEPSPQTPASPQTQVSPSASAPRPQLLPQLPPSWRSPSISAPAGNPSLLLLGAGLSVFHLRTLPLVGRQEERDQLWNSLHRLHTERQPQVILLEGSSGTGKSRLAAWFTERAHEVGAATILTASFSPAANASEELARMGLRHFQALDLPRARVRSRIATVLARSGPVDPLEVAALTELFLPISTEDDTTEGQDSHLPIPSLDWPATSSDTATFSGEGLASTPFSEASGSPLVRFGSQTEQHNVLRRWLHRLSQERPLIVWLEDVQWGSDALAFTHHLLDARETRFPILFLMTVREDVLNDRHVEQQQLIGLRARPEVQTIALTPLHTSEQQALVEELLRLEPQLAQKVVERTGGNPLFAVQLVGDWIQRELLVLTPRGFELVPQSGLHLPDTVHQVWRARIERMLQLHPLGAQVALELAAALGQQVQQREWEAVCEALGLPRPERLLTSLLHHRLVVWTEEGLARGQEKGSRWRFVHAMLRETLERDAREAGRWRDHHRVCARLIQALTPPEAPLLAERLAFHLMEGALFEQALEQLFTATEQRHTQGYPQEVKRLLELQQDVLNHLPLSQSDGRRARVQLTRCRLLVMERQFDAGLEALDRLEQEAIEHQWLDVKAESLLLRAKIHSFRGNPVLSERFAREGHALFESLHMEARATETLRVLATNASLLGRQAEAEASLKLAHQRFLERRDRLGQWSSLYHLARIMESSQRTVEAATYMQKALDVAEKLGAQRLIANSLNGLGVLEYDEHPAGAVGYFERSLSIFYQTGDILGQTIALGNLADARRSLLQFDQAEKLYCRAIVLLERLGSSEAGNTRINLGLLYLMWEEYGHARQTLLDSYPDLTRLNEPNLVAAYYLGLLLCAAAEGRWLEWDALMDSVKLWLANGKPERQARWTLPRASELAEQAGELVRAQQGYELALSLWQKADEDIERRPIEAALNRIKARLES